MALHVPKAPGMAQMLKDGARYFSGLEEAVYRNINACKQFSQTVRTAYGPNGMNKMVINHIEKLFVTNDAATIIRELEVEHPAAKLMILASQMQEQEVGDGTNFVIILSGALLEAAEELLRMGLTSSEIVDGYELALEKALEILPTLTCYEIKDYRKEEDTARGIKPAIMSKQYGNEDFLTKLITKACVSNVPEKTTFNVDNIRVCKILGSGLQNSDVVQGMVFKRTVDSDVLKKSPAKVAVFTCAVDIMQTETKGTVLIKSADELMQFSRGEENLLENQIKAIADAGADVIVSGGKFGDMALHYINKYNMMAVKLSSKWDIRRVCKTVGATALPRLTAPTKEELGYADHVYVDELGDTSVVVFKLEGRESRIATIVIRGSTDNYMDDIERAVDDGVNTFKGITRDGRFVPGAGATEIELARQIASFAETRPGLEQYAIKKFATALETFVKCLAENSGVKSSEVVSKLYAAHEEGKKNHGFDIEGEGAAIIDVAEAGIIDLYLTKMWGLKYATNAACTILKVDQIIMAKRAGGPKAPQAGGQNDED
ncbi:T-complex protein 1 subunit theta [Schistocerca piceifrons]|uniref:T-complex protein 1 subunit theta n=1 Tax=Schistocerca piceifrons TaxID=274613 RepID=UPI001F5F1FBC|nr:T-complex protein 1 subunit theta [Schistocerca piceifrons]XP_049788758.1 T-complex protein 1 subunit theta [Schistocerca nitens]XP_049939926.1 T-complex protein 1 subunit theta [Schistocerca serialis cubense]